MNRTEIIRNACTAGTEAAAVEYDALTPGTARALRSDVVPDYAGDAARVIVSAAFGLDSEDVRGTRIERAATQAWAEAFRAAWPAEDVARLAAQEDDVSDGGVGDDFALSVSYSLDSMS